MPLFVFFVWDGNLRWIRVTVAHSGAVVAALCTLQPLLKTRAFRSQYYGCAEMVENEQQRDFKTCFDSRVVPPSLCWGFTTDNGYCVLLPRLSALWGRDMVASERQTTCASVSLDMTKGMPLGCGTGASFLLTLSHTKWHWLGLCLL